MRGVTRRRVWPAIVLALAALPGQCIRSAPPPKVETVSLTLTALPIPADAAIARAGAEIALEAAWELSSPHSDFGGLSGLALGKDGRLVAVSDMGLRIAFARPPARPAPVYESLTRAGLPKELRDVEAVAFGPDGREWIAFEGVDRLARRRGERDVWTPAATAETAPWAANSGVETMTFLADGRLLLMEESTAKLGGRARALLYDIPALYEDAAASPLAFTFVPPPGYRPTDAATLPDGRVAILLRAVRMMPPGFLAKIAIADPADIAAGKDWRAREIARIAAPAPVDNMEGIAVSERGDGALDLWLVSDDNAVSLQRTLLLKLSYRP